MKAVIIISHGSHSPKTKQEIEILTEILRKKSNIPIVAYAFLEIESPDIPTGIKNAVEKGATEILILLNFLNSGKHVDQDIPRIIDEASKKYPKTRIIISPPAGLHAKYSDLLLDIIRQTK